MFSNRQIIDKQGFQTQEFRTWTKKIEGNLTIGTGVPTSATEGYLYLDLEGAAGSVLYANTNNGWVLA